MTAVLLLTLLRLYKAALSPLLPPACRFYPTCSEYAYEAIEQHGPVQGLRLALTRLSRCHPFHAGGPDFVPQAVRPAAPLRAERGGR